MATNPEIAMSERVAKASSVMAVCPLAASFTETQLTAVRRATKITADGRCNAMLCYTRQRCNAVLRV